MSMIEQRHCARCGNKYRVVYDTGEGCCPFCDWRRGALNARHLVSYCGSYVDTSFSSGREITQELVSTWMMLQKQADDIRKVLERNMIWNLPAPRGSVRSDLVADNKVPHGAGCP